MTWSMHARIARSDTEDTRNQLEREFPAYLQDDLRDGDETTDVLGALHAAAQLIDSGAVSGGVGARYGVNLSGHHPVDGDLGTFVQVHVSRLADDTSLTAAAKATNAAPADHVDETTTPPTLTQGPAPLEAPC